MKTRELVALFVCSTVPWAVGAGLIPQLPVYAAQLGAGPAAAGLYLAFYYLGLASGNFAAGWISQRLGRRRLPLAIAGLVGIPVTWAISQVTTVRALTVPTAVLWFFGGMGLAFVNILAGLGAGPDKRGRVFGALSITAGLGGMIGALGAGYITEHWGSTATFSVTACFLVTWPLTAAFVTEHKTGLADVGGTRTGGQDPVGSAASPGGSLTSTPEVGQPGR